MIGIIDYGMGNLRSVQKAFEHEGARAQVLATPADLTDDVQRLVLPGVGAFGDGMRHLSERGWVEPIRQFVDSGRPFLGVCLGMQLLFDGSQEDALSPDALVPGLSLLPGTVVRFTAAADQRLKIPHMGWNTARWDRDDPLLSGLEQDAWFYFVHSYYVAPADTDVASATTDYGQPFCASVWRKNIWATQFHPEKSQSAGLKILANFAAL